MNDIKNNILEITKSAEYIEYNKYHEGNIFAITKTSRLEQMHSNFIAWILDSQSHHGLNDYPIKQFLAALQIIKSRSVNINLKWASELDNLIPNIQFDSNYTLVCKSEREVALNLPKKRSIDILLIVSFETKKQPIIIENKVDSSEHDDQTVDYFNWSEQSFKKSEYLQPIYVYLSPKYNSSNPKNKYFIEMKYQDLLDYVLEPSLLKCTDNKAKNHISEYIHCLSYQSDNKKGGNTMAISNEEKEILQNFYDKNKNLMNAIIEMMLDDDDVDPSLKDKMSNLVSNKDFSKYEFNGKEYGKNKLVLAVVKQYIEDHKPTDFTELESAFPKSLQGSFGVVKKYDKLSDSEKNHKRFYIDSSDILETADNTKCVVCTQWSTNNIDEFINKAREYNYSINKK